MQPSKTDAQTPDPRPGLRERNKLAKLTRIREAARDLFVSRGYDQTTTREVARLADVGLGTLFTYAVDKRDLLFLIVNDELEDMTASAVQALRHHDGLEPQLLDIFRRHYLFFAQLPALSRFMLREQQFYADTAQATRFQATRSRAQSLVRDAVTRAQQAGALTATADARLCARLIFGVFQMELRDWLSHDKLDLDAGMAALARSLAMLLDGVRTNTSRGATRPKPSTGKAPGIAFPVPGQPAPEPGA